MSTAVPERVRREWAHEIEMEKQEERTRAAREQRTAAKLEQARTTLSEWPLERLEQAYADYIEALVALVSYADVLAHIAEPVRTAHRVLADAGEVTEPAPAPLSVRSSSDHELRALRIRAWECTNGDL